MEHKRQIQFYLATTNSNKIKEIKSFLRSIKFFASSSQVSKANSLIKSLKNLKNYSPVKEIGLSFKENAILKSSHLLNDLSKRGLLLKPLGILAEDSGLEVKSLAGAPGIYSARYSGLKANDKRNNQLLLKNLKNHKNREARYVCVLSFIFVKNSNSIEKTFEGYCKGEIVYKERGRGGFGYDPLFIPKGETKTFAELSFQFKQEISHRKKALKKWQKYLEEKKILSIH